MGFYILLLSVCWVLLTLFYLLVGFYLTFNCHVLGFIVPVTEEEREEDDIDALAAEQVSATLLLLYIWGYTVSIEYISCVYTIPSMLVKYSMPNQLTVYCFVE